MKSSEIRKRFLAFFEKRGHAILPSAPLVPENDPSVLFNTAGMQPLVPYLLGEKHPQGVRLANFQKCVRTVDIDEIGDNTHATFFEMMGNWSLGDYFKREAIQWSYELLTSKEEGFGLDPQRLYVTCFEGDENAPKDEESASIWREIFEKNGVTGERIYFMPAKSNWWSPGDNGPCGPDTEMFYDVTGELTHGLTKREYIKADDAQNVVEIWNDVFMEYQSKDGKVVGKLAAQNVDTGSGFERVTMVLQNTDNIFDTDIFKPIMDKIDEFTSTAGNSDIIKKSKRIVADHVRTSVMLISDGVEPSNKDQGYVLRRLIRRAVLHCDSLGIKKNSLFWIADTVTDAYKDIYENVGKLKETIKVIIDKEEQKFRGVLDSARKKIDAQLPKYKEGSSYLYNATSGTAFIITTHGVPYEIIKEIYKEKGVFDYINEGDLDREVNSIMEAHKALSRAGAEQKFKGGLGDTGEMSVRYHTATHLLHQALRDVLGTHVQQKGSNITPERLRFDFSHPAKMTDEEKKRVEDIVNEKIREALPVRVVSLPFAEAEKTGALHFFGEKYGDTVTVYYIGNDEVEVNSSIDGDTAQNSSLEKAYSKEFCGGPHVKNTSELGVFKIQKEEAVSQGVRRIKAVLS